MTESFSLMDLMEFNSDEVMTLTTRNLPDGIYVFLVKDFEAKDSEPKDDKPALAQFVYAYEVESAKLVDKKLDPLAFVGRESRDTITFWPRDLPQVIGLLKGNYQKVGLETKGQIGVWAPAIIGHRITCKVQSSTRNGQSRVYYEWMGPAKPAGE